MPQEVARAAESRVPLVATKQESAGVLPQPLRKKTVALATRVSQLAVKGPTKECNAAEKSAALQVHCAKAVLTTACAAGTSIEPVLAEALETHPLNIGKGLGRYNLLNEKAYDSWCDLLPSGLDQALALAMVPKKSKPLGHAGSNMEYMRWALASEDGKIDVAGFGRALDERRQMINAAEKQSTNTSSALNNKSLGLPIQTLAAGLPAAISGWTNLTGYTHPVGRVNDLLIDNTGTTTTRTMWAGTDGGGIWKTTNGGTVNPTWTPINDFSGSLSIGKILRSPRNTTEMYASTNPYGAHAYSPFGILKSNDGGNTWNQLPSTSPTASVDWEFVTSFAIHPAGVGGFDVLLAATFTGIFQSSDSGATWTKIASGFGSWVAFHPTDGSRRAYAINDGRIHVTTNGIWTGAASNLLVADGSASFTKFAFAPSDVNILYALTNVTGNLTSLLRSADGGATWTAVATPTNIFFHSQYLNYTGGLWVDPTNANRIHVMEARAFSTLDATTATSTTGWAQSTVYWVDHHGSAADPGFNGTTNKIFYATDDGGIYRYNDVDVLTGGLAVGLGLTVSELYDVGGRAPGPYAFAAQDTGVRFYRQTVADPVMRWRLRNTGPGIGDGVRVVADRNNPTTLYAATQFLNLHRSTDGGVNSTLICQGITDVACTTQSGNAAFLAPFILDPNNQSLMLAGAASLWRSTDVTATTPTWATIHSGSGSVVSAIAIAPSDSNVIWVAYQNGAVYKTANGLATTPTWTPVSVPAGNKLKIFIDRTDAQTVYLGLSGFAPNRLQKTINGGSTWQSVAGLPSAGVFAIEAHPAKPSWLYVGTSVGLFTSENSGATWSASNEGPANVQVSALHWYSETGNTAELLVGTFGRGVWKATVMANNGPTLSVTKTGTGTGNVVSAPAGIDCGVTCSNTFALNTLVTLVAAADAGMTFAGWSGGGCSGTGPCTVTISAAQSVSATFNVLEAFPTNCTLPAGWVTPAGANGGWSVATDRKRSGTCSLKSNPIGNGTISVPAKAQVQATGNFAAGNVSFFYNVSSEANFDCLRVYVDTVSRAEIGSNCTSTSGFGQSGNITTWTQVTIPLASGTHSIVWSYEKDNSTVAGSDAAWIDDVTLPPLANGGSLQFASAASSVNETSGSVILNVTRTAGSGGAASVAYATANGTATAGADYGAQTGTLNWADGDSADKTITLPIFNNPGAEGTETFTVTLSAASGAALGSPATTTVSIVEPAPTLQFNGALSRITHPSLGACAIPLSHTLPLNGAINIEPRQRGTTHRVVFQFNGVVNSVGSVALTDALNQPIGAATGGALGGNEFEVLLTGALDGQRVMVSLTGVNGTLSAQTPIGFLVGDFANTRIVSASDISAVKATSGQALGLANCRYDVNVDGTISNADVSMVKARSGLSVP